jgi:hypothetical protein
MNPSSGDQHLFAAFGSLDQPRQVGFGLVHVDNRHGRRSLA